MIRKQSPDTHRFLFGSLEGVKILVSMESKSF